MSVQTCATVRRAGEERDATNVSGRSAHKRENSRAGAKIKSRRFNEETSGRCEKHNLQVRFVFLGGSCDQEVGAVRQLLRCFPVETISSGDDLHGPRRLRCLQTLGSSAASASNRITKEMIR